MFVEALVTFVIILSGIWFLTEVLQGIWYESVVSNLVPRVLLAATILTALQLYLRIRLESLMDVSLPWVIVSGIIWSVVFYAIFQFSAGHAMGLGIGGMLVLTCLSGMVSDGFRGIGAGPARPSSAARKRAEPPIRMPRVAPGFSPFQVPTAESRGKADAKAANTETTGTQKPAASDPVPAPQP